MQPLVRQPGEGWEYGVCNFPCEIYAWSLTVQVNIDWAGILLERATAISLNDYLHRNVFEPLGLKDISMLPTASMKANLALMNQRAPDGQLSSRDHPLHRPFIVQSPEEVKGYFNSGGAGCFAKPQEYCRKSPKAARAAQSLPTSR